MNFFICSAQTFTLQELETYAKYDFETFSRKVIAKGYEFYKSEDNTIAFIYPTNSIKSTYMIIYGKERLLYWTTNKTNYMTLMNDIKGKGYKYIGSTIKEKNKVCIKNQAISNLIESCMSSQETNNYGLPMVNYTMSLNLMH